jgi:hypothetical protein
MKRRQEAAEEAERQRLQAEAGKNEDTIAFDNEFFTR